MTPKQFALTAHGNQRYYEHPYEYHLQAVHDVLVEFGYTDEDLLAAAWLHDVIEDTPYTFSDIHREFCLRIALIVDGVTDEPGVYRAERHRKTYPKTASDQAYTIVKLADRISNMRESVKAESLGLWQMYWREYPEFRKALKEPWGAVHKYQENPSGLPAMWAELDRLSKYGSHEDVHGGRH